MDNLVCCIQCLELVDYEDAVYEDDDAKDDFMVCIECYCLECYVKKLIQE